jgi:hypothetical protein
MITSPVGAGTGALELIMASLQVPPGCLASLLPSAGLG